MKQIIILTCSLFVCSLVFSQTKLIAHRSHSGKNSTFKFQQLGNFGLPSHKKDSSEKKVDTVVKKVKPPVSNKLKYKKKSVVTAKK